MTDEGCASVPVARSSVENVSDVPAVRSDRFRCPSCDTVAMQRWYPCLQTESGALTAFKIGTCDRCQQPTIWLGSELVFPDRSRAPQPNEDLDAEERALYAEASSVLGRSPRAAAALLRLLCEHLAIRIVGHAGTLNSLIGELVAAHKISADLQMALDAVRISGNNLVHPGQIDAEDHSDVALAMFGFINLAAERLLTEPRRIRDLYAELPEGPRQAVERRDGSSG